MTHTRNAARQSARTNARSQTNSPTQRVKRCRALARQRRGHGPVLIMHIPRQQVHFCNRGIANERCAAWPASRPPSKLRRCPARPSRTRLRPSLPCAQLTGPLRAAIARCYVFLRELGQRVQDVLSSLRLHVERIPARCYHRRETAPALPLCPHWPPCPRAHADAKPRSHLGAPLGQLIGAARDAASGAARCAIRDQIGNGQKRARRRTHSNICLASGLGCKGVAPAAQRGRRAPPLAGGARPRTR